MLAEERFALILEQLNEQRTVTCLLYTSRCV